MRALAKPNTAPPTKPNKLGIATVAAATLTGAFTLFHVATNDNKQISRKELDSFFHTGFNHSI